MVKRRRLVFLADQTEGWDYIQAGSGQSDVGYICKNWRGDYKFPMIIGRGFRGAKFYNSQESVALDSGLW
jgi:hypothetical protein